MKIGAAISKVLKVEQYWSQRVRNIGSVSSLCWLYNLYKKKFKNFKELAHIFSNADVQF